MGRGGTEEEGEGEEKGEVKKDGKVKGEEKGEEKGEGGVEECAQVREVAAEPHQRSARLDWTFTFACEGQVGCRTRTLTATRTVAQTRALALAACLTAVKG